MHEMSLVRDVVDVVVKAAEAHGVSKIEEIDLTIGYGRDVVPELFDGLFHYLSRGTVAEGAELVVTNTPFMVRCRDCGQVYHLNTLDQSSWPCPCCGHVNYDVVSGMEFRIDAIKVGRSTPETAQVAAVA